MGINASTDRTHEEQLERVIDVFWEVIPPTWNRIRSNIRAIVTENFDITVEQFHILRHIRKGIDSVSELAEEKQISRPAISQIVETLVEKGLVTRQQSVDDRRFVRLALTSSGSELISAIFHKNREWMAEQLRQLSADELQAVRTGMEAFRGAFSAAGEQNATNPEEA